MTPARPTTAPDLDLLGRMRRGDETAARELWSRHAPRLTAYTRAILARRDPAGAPDIVQQVFLAALRLSRTQARAIADPAAWFLRLTRNAALNRLRSLGREHRRTSTAGGPLPALPPSSDPHLLDLHSALSSLPGPLREVVTLKHCADLSFDQMAAALGVNRNTLATRYQRALTLLRRRLDLEAPRDPRGSPRSTMPSCELTHARP